MRLVIKPSPAPLAFVVKSGYELLAQVKESPFDIVILDLIMPEKDGISIFSTIRSISPDAKIIVYTGFSKYENSILAKEADKFIIKSDDPNKLVEAIEGFAKNNNSKNGG